MFAALFQNAKVTTMLPHWMPSRRVLFCLTLVLLIQLGASAVMSRDIHTDYDVIIVGGGPAGLAALSALGRIRRKALLVDSGEYRNAPTRLMHDVLGFDGVKPAYFRWAAMREIMFYPSVKGINATVTKIQPSKKKDYFTVKIECPDDKPTTRTARRIILGTGLQDILPQTPGVKDGFGKGIYWCPWCDGLEHADQTMGILGPLDRTVEAAAEVSTLNKNVILFANGTDTPENRAAAGDEFCADSFKYLKKRNYKIDNRTITSITRLRNGHRYDADPHVPSVKENDRFRIELDGVSTMVRDVFFAVFDYEQKSVLPRQLGVKLDKKGKMVVDDQMRTSIPNLYAVGDANSDKRTNVLHSLHSGKVAAVHIHVQMEREFAKCSMSTATSPDEEDDRLWKRGSGDDEEALWDRVRGSPGEVLYSG